MKAVTFDFWNTLMWEAPRGLLDARLRAITGILDELGHPAAIDQLEAAHQAAFLQYQAAWTVNSQYVVADAVATMLSELRLAPEPDISTRLAAAFSDAGAVADVRPCAGVAECLHHLADAGLKLGVVCDIGLTPSSVVRGYLRELGLLEMFGAVAFSDEIGWYKPDPRTFAHALSGLSVDDPSDAVHVGDRTRTDVAGALRLGMKAVRYRGVYDDPEAGPAATFVIDDLRELPGLLLD